MALRVLDMRLPAAAVCCSHPTVFHAPSGAFRAPLAPQTSRLPAVPAAPISPSGCFPTRPDSQASLARSRPCCPSQSCSALRPSSYQTPFLAPPSRLQAQNLRLPPQRSRQAHSPHSSPARCQAAAPEAATTTGLFPPTTYFHTLDSGKRIEVLEHKGRPGSGSVPPILFLHGSYHAAWCWQEHWMPYFAELGHDCYAVSLIGQGKSDNSDEKVAGTLQTHASQVAHFIAQRIGRPPVLVGHSFGALIVQAYLSRVATTPEERSDPSRLPPLAGAVVACSVPPTGNAKLVMRFIVNRPIASLKITYSLAMGGYAKSLPICKESFFSPAMPNEEVDRYRLLMAVSCRQPLFDLRLLNASLPVPKPPPGAPPICVLAAEKDFIVDEHGVDETAEFFDTQPVWVNDIAHDVMLDIGWDRAASQLQDWLAGKGLSQLISAA